MRTKFVFKTGLVKRGANGDEAIVFTDGDTRDGEIRWADVKALPSPKIGLGSEIWLESGEQIRLPFTQLLWILPDRTGVIAIFRAGQYLNPQGEDFFPAPCNAAIFNADGSLRCQVYFSEENFKHDDYIIERLFTRSITHKYVGGFYGVGERVDPPIEQFGVLVGTKVMPPERFYVLNTETGELTNGYFTVPY
jgi:hypothetical protein